MPTYDVDIPGKGTFTLNAEQEMSDEEIQQAAAQFDAGGGNEPQQQEGRFAKMFGGEPDPTDNFLQKFAHITGRRVGEAADAFTNIPSNAWDIVTGGQEGGFTGRGYAALKTLQGIAAPVSVLTSPIEAAAEEATTGITGSEKAGRFVGDISGGLATIGLGLMGKAGMLGGWVEQYAKAIGATAPREFQDLIKRDPQLAFVAEAPPAPASSALERMARGTATMEELAVEAAKPQKTVADIALDMNRPAMAESELTRMTAAADDWVERAKTNNIMSEPPPEPRVDRGPMSFLRPIFKDWTILHNLGTTATRAAAFGQDAANVALDVLRTDAQINQAAANWRARAINTLTGVGDADVSQGVLLHNVKNFEEVMAAPESRVTQAVKNVVQFFQNRNEVQRNIAIPALRDQLRERFTNLVAKDMPNATQAEMAAEVIRRLDKAVPDNFAAGETVRAIFPGNFTITDAKGVPLFTAHNGLDAKMKIHELVQNGMDVGDIKVSTRANFDSDLLRLFKGRVSRTYKNLSDSMNLTKDEIEAAARGEYLLQSSGAQKAFDYLGAIREKIPFGKSTNYTKDLIDVLSTQDRAFERWLQVGELRRRVAPMIKEIGDRYPLLAEKLDDNMKLLWGHRMPGSQGIDNLIASTPILRDVMAPYALEKAIGFSKGLMVNALLKYRPSFHIINSTQTAATLWPIAGLDEITEGVKLRASDAGKSILARHGVIDTSKVEGASRGLGISEKFNQETAFLTMYNRARKFGLTDQQAADYGLLRGRVYSQFMGLTTDQPMAFRSLDPMGILTMFQRFPIKQTEMIIDLMKHKDYPAAAKWLGVNLALGGFKAATMGNVGWLSYKVYKDLEDRYGKPVADMFHTGLPGLAGIDLSSSVQLFNPPFGETWGERAMNFMKGPLISNVQSVVGNMLAGNGPDPNAFSRGFNALAERVVPVRWAKTLIDLVEGTAYDFKDPQGRLRYRGDWTDVLKSVLGLRDSGGTMGVTAPPQEPASMTGYDSQMMRPGKYDTFIDAMMDLKQRRDDILDYAASRYGQALASGVDLGKDMQETVQKEVDGWNNLWPEMPIDQKAIIARAQARRDSVMQGVAQRVMKSAPAAIKKSPLFAPPQQTSEPVPPPPGLPFEFYGGG